MVVRGIPEEINEQDVTGSTLLTNLCKGPEAPQNLTAIRELIKSSHIIDVPDQHEYSALDHACSLGREDHVRLISDKIEPQDSSFFIACSKGHSSIVSFLITRMDIKKINMSFALDAACASSHLEVIRVIGRHHPIPTRWNF
jgi:ankyrin repeat protein